MKQSEDLFRETLSFQKANLKPNHPDIGITMNNLAGVLQSQNQLNYSVELYKETLIFRKANLEPNNPDFGNSLNNLALIL